MSRKLLLYDFVKEYIEKQKYTLLSSIYEGAHNRLKLLCPRKHQIEMSFNSFYYNQSRCQICMIENKCLPLKIIKKALKDLELIWISGSYRDVHSKLVLKCKNGHISSKRIDGILYNKYGCKKCSDKIAGPKRAKYGEDSHFWIKDRSIVYLPYTEKFVRDDDGLRNQIFSEQNKICIICKKEIIKKKCCHHIDYNKRNDSRKNLCILDSVCHAKTNHNRNFWEDSLKNSNSILLGEI